MESGTEVSPLGAALRAVAREREAEGLGDRAGTLWDLAEVLSQLPETPSHRPEALGLPGLYAAELTDRYLVIDPGDEEDWDSWTLGWAIAKGLSPAEAREFVRSVRYGCDE